MNLKEYVDGLNDLLKSNPELAEAKVISSGDDEGNFLQFRKLHTFRFLY